MDLGTAAALAAAAGITVGIAGAVAADAAAWVRRRRRRRTAPPQWAREAYGLAAADYPRVRVVRTWPEVTAWALWASARGGWAVVVREWTGPYGPDGVAVFAYQVWAFADGHLSGTADSLTDPLDSATGPEWVNEDDARTDEEGLG